MRTLVIAALIGGYAVLAHYSNARAGARALGVVLAVAPILGVILLLLLRAGLRLTALLVAALGAAAVARFWPLLSAHFPWLYLAQQAGTYVLLGVVFGRSLLPGRVPLCTHWASQVHGVLRPEVLAYTRHVTVAWTLFFASLSATLLVLFFLAPLPVWSAFANFCCLPLIAAMFVGEYLLRTRVLPEMEHAGIFAGVRAFLGADVQADALRRG
jgi:uncharacterized membrane protein